MIISVKKLVCRGSLLLAGLLAMLVTPGRSTAQSSVKGVVADTAEKKSVQYAAVTLITRTDSVLTAFARTNRQGQFVLNNVPAGKYIYLISCPGYADYAEFAEVDTNEQKDLGTLSLFLKENLLRAVIIKDRVAAIVVKGDTVEFKADSFATREGASVEDLLKKLPGVQVDRNGNIQAFGKTVEQVLVDGEEFFGDDPTLATQNLKAEAVDKVQVFDKKSEQATFTGVDDGETKRTINIQLKEDARKGHFGKVGAASNFSNYHDGQLMANRFRRSMKASGYAIGNNYKYSGLGWDDRRKYAGKEYEYNEDEDYFFSYWEGDEDYIGEKGFPVNFEAGAHYSNKWKDGKHKFAFNYNYEQKFVKYNDSSYARTLFPDSTFLSSDFSGTEQDRRKHSISLKYEWQIDSLTSLKITGSSGQRFRQSITDGFSSAVANEKDRVNDNTQHTTNNSNKTDGEYALLLKRKMKKTGRTLVFNFNQKLAGEDADGTLISTYNLYAAGGSSSQNNINQLKVNDYSSNKISTSLTYTEPLTKTVLIEGQYSYGWSREKASRLSYNDSVAYGRLDTFFSNSFDYGLSTNRAGLYVKLNKKKYTLKAGAAINRADFHTINLFTDSTLRYHFINLFPQVTFSYKFSPQKRLGFTYSGSTRAPSLYQLQPLRNNANPFSIGIGNPGLKQEYSQTVTVNYNFYKVLGGSGLWSSLSYTNTLNDIVQATDVDAYGKQTYRFVNVDGNYNLWGYGSYHYSIKKKHNLSVSLNLNYTKAKNLQKGLENTNRYGSISPTFGYSFDKDKWPEMSISYRPGFNNSSSSLNPDGRVNYWTHSVDASIFTTLFKRYELNSDVDFTRRQRLDLNSKNNNFIIWNASVSRKVFKDKSGRIAFSVNDILKQRLGYNRWASGSQVSENYYTIVTRYWLLRFTWNFTDKATRAAKNNDDDDED